MQAPTTESPGTWDRIWTEKMNSHRNEEGGGGGNCVAQATC